MEKIKSRLKKIVELYQNGETFEAFLEIGDMMNVGESEKTSIMTSYLQFYLFDLHLFELSIYMLLTLNEKSRYPFLVDWLESNAAQFNKWQYDTLLQMIRNSAPSKNSI